MQNSSRCTRIKALMLEMDLCMTQSLLAKRLLATHMQAKKQLLR